MEGTSVTGLLAETDGNVASPGLRFVPFALPCGECRACRRAMPHHCPASRPATSLLAEISEGRPSSAIEVPERYVSVVDIDGGSSLQPAVAAAAGAAAVVLDAIAHAGLEPWHTAFWLGGNAMAHLGAAAALARGCRVFLLAPEGPPWVSPAGARPSAPILLQPSSGPAEWHRVLAALEAPFLERPGDERRVFVCGREPALLAAAFALSVPGTTISLLAPPVRGSICPTTMPLPHILQLGGYDPDLIPEALALIRRGEIPLAAFVREVARDEFSAALSDLRRSRDLRLPVLRL